MKKVFGVVWRVLVILVAVVVLAAAAFILYLHINEYKPADVETCEVVDGTAATLPKAGQSIRIMTWNIGYAGLDKDADFFMDGGTGVRAESEARVKANLAGISATMAQAQADVYLVQEVDRNSTRTFGIDETAYLTESGTMSHAFALNYSCNWVPFPLPMLGRIQSGVMTLSSYTMDDAQRIALPCPFGWPLRLANLKRCLLVSRTPIEGSDKELVLVNLHLEAYDDGAGKEAQTKMLFDFLAAEYQKGNYVIAGGDFNCVFSSAADAYPIRDGVWTPGSIDESTLPDGFTFHTDDTTPTCRLLNEPYSTSTDPQFYVIDGFLCSANLSVTAVQTIDAGFTDSDHNPVVLDVTLSAE